VTRPEALIAQATQAIARLRERFLRQTRCLALACSDAAQIVAARVDRQQVALYEIAWAGAELLAAEATLQALAPQAAALSQLEERLALTHVTEAVASIADRQDLIALDIDDEYGTEISVLDSLHALRREVLAGAALDETGRQLCESTDDLAPVALADDLVMVRAEFSRMAADLVAPLAESIHRQDLTVPETLLQPLRELGVFGLSIPQRYGGSAPDDRHEHLLTIVVTETLSEASLAAAGSLITRPEILTRALLAGGTETQKEFWLPRIARGEPLCAIAITEPDYGSDVAQVQLRAIKAPGGWLLNGAKTWCTFAGKAGLIMAVVRTSPDRALGHRGLSVLLVEKPSYDGHAFTYRQPEGGTLSGKAIPTVGYRGMHSFVLAFDNVFVPDSHVVGEEGGLGQGFYYTMAGMVGGRLQTAARASGVMRAAILQGLRYAADRRVFNAPLASYPLVRAKLVRMAARYAACRRLTYAVGRMLDRGAGRMEASLVKLYACRSAEWITREAQQLHGGMGYAEEMPISRYFVDARVLSIFEGAEETLALKVIARTMLEEALRGAQ
jgi:(2S)-methylsuccinyl-CoA dehydrogenase